MVRPSSDDKPASAALQALIAAARRNHPLGNRVEWCRLAQPRGDADLGQAGGPAVVERRLLEPEPVFSAVPVEAVRRSGGALWYSDLRIAVSRPALQEAELNEPES